MRARPDKLTLDVKRELRRLKGFQRKTVDYVFSRLYDDERSTRRFLVADEVGLGKTLVARGVVAKAIAHLHQREERIDIVYVCSNATIAQQNVRRLNVFGDRELAIATRLTMLPKLLAGLRGNHVNFISFTPGTTFDLKSSGGCMDERAVVYRMLTGRLGLDETGLRNLLQGGAGQAGWKRVIAETEDLDDELVAQFTAAVADDPALLARLRDGCEQFTRSRDDYPGEQRRMRNQVTGDLRLALARLCITSLAPNLVILDEFQRFKHLLHGDDPAASLAQVLFDYAGTRLLLLSATPYRMLTLDYEEEDHYADFRDTLRFLFREDEGQVEALRGEMQAFRELLLQFRDVPTEQVARAREAVERRMLQVMCRTERVGTAADPNAMMREQVLQARPTRADLEQAMQVADVAQALGAQDTVEYWKSSPYLLQFMRDRYDIGQRLRRRTRTPQLMEALHRSEEVLTAERVLSYERLEPANARLRLLFDKYLHPERGLWKLLWLPPSLPYYQLEGAYASVSEATKALIFSAWSVVPDAIAALCSYEAERLMLADDAERPAYDELTRARRGTLQYHLADGKPDRMTVLALAYPSCVLADHLDPLLLAVDSAGDPPSLDSLRSKAREVVEALLRRTHRWPGPSGGRPDEDWYWAAPSLLDQYHANGVVPLWLDGDGPSEDGDSRDSMGLYGQRWYEMTRRWQSLGSPPEDLVDVLVELGLGGPAVCAARALRRIAPNVEWDGEAFLSAVCGISERLRLMYNLPTSAALLRDPQVPFWRRVLQYNVEGGLQAVLDEWVHILVEQEGLLDQPENEKLKRLGDAIDEALSVHTATLKVDALPNGQVSSELPRLRCRFAMRLGDARGEDDKTVHRAAAVRAAFNSPFPPFLLATTSIGQEGLDFHPYCHVVYHWNLPSNPVDLEQREGRVNRYKGHAVRKNVASFYGLELLRLEWEVDRDPWEELFRQAVGDRPEGASDLEPYWLYPGAACIERIIPELPFSREQGRLALLKRNLAVYRLAFGQPRQDDLLAFLRHELGEGDLTEFLEQWRISLAPG